MKLTKILRSKKGMTLMELIIALMILAILIPAVTTCIFSAMRQYAWTKSYADMAAVVSVIDGTVERELSLANGAVPNNNSITYYKNGTQLQTMETRVDADGFSILYIGNDPAFDIAFYKDVSVVARFESLSSGVISVTLTYSGVSTYVSTFVVDALSAA